jgi:hypothetical protein
MKKHESDLRSQFVQHLDCLQAHDVVVASQTTRMLILKEM